VKSWHPNREMGEFTHYGDQALVRLESMAAAGRFDLDRFAKSWQALFADYDGYVDKATTATLKNFADGRDPTASGSASDDLGGASRMAALVWHYRNDPDGLASAATAQTAMTHNNPAVLAGAGFLARATSAVLGGTPPAEALQAAAEEDKASPIAEWVADGLDSIGVDTRQAISDFGQMCEIDAAFPATIHLIAKYESNLKEALVENVMAGGDSSSRGMVVGMVLGAHLGLDAIPSGWIADMRRGEDIRRILEATE
jgi:ADP-ribosylglycohydrolase